MKDLKEKIEAERGKDNFPVSGQKLIYAGKILQDDTPIKDYNIDEKNFVVVMVSKVRCWSTVIPPDDIDFDGVVSVWTALSSICIVVLLFLFGWI